MNARMSTLNKLTWESANGSRICRLHAVRATTIWRTQKVCLLCHLGEKFRLYRAAREAFSVFNPLLHRC